MDGKPYQVGRFATTLRRQLFREHLGLISPQFCESRREPVTSFMRCAPVPNEDNINDPYDALVSDPLADATLQLWNDTARRNRELFTEVFRPIPSNLVRSWSAYDVRSRPGGCL
jgi:phospholipase D1/2